MNFLFADLLILFHKPTLWSDIEFSQSSYKYSKCQAPTPVLRFIHVNVRPRQLTSQKIKINQETEEDDNHTSSLDKDSFLKKIVGLRPAILFKKKTGTGVFLWILWNFKEQLFTEHVRWLLLYLAFFFSQISGQYKQFWSIVAVREKEYKKQLVNCFLNVICFKHLEIIHCNFFLLFLSF